MCQYGIVPDQRCFSLLACASATASTTLLCISQVSLVEELLSRLLFPAPQWSKPRVDEWTCSHLIQALVSMTTEGRVLSKTNVPPLTEALKVLQFMDHHNIIPHVTTYLQLLKGSTVVKDLAAGTLVHQHIISSNNKKTRFGSGPVQLDTALMSMYSKCGSLNSCCAAFDNLSLQTVQLSYSSVSPNGSSWSLL